MRWKPTLTVVASMFLLVIAGRLVLAQSSSSSYQIEESYIGPGGQLDSSSASYEARASLGDTGIGYSESAAYGLWAGYTTTEEPYLEIVVTGAVVDLGLLTTSTTGTGTGSFYVRSYLSSGYVVTTSPASLANDSYSLTNLAAAAPSAVDTEQFGINLVANTAPTSFGANPNQIPDASFGFGQAAAGYNTANNYRYNEGDTVALSNSSSGVTDYTISYIANINSITPGGVYTMAHSLIATPTF